VRAVHPIVLISMGLAILTVGCSDLDHSGTPMEPKMAEGAGGNLPTHDRYIIRVESADRLVAVAQMARQNGGAVEREWRNTIFGMVAHLPPAAVNALLGVPGVLFVARDVGVYSHSSQSAQLPPWNLDRIDQRHRNLDGQFIRHYNGSGVRIYVLGSGVDANHPEVAGRVVGAWTYNSNYPATSDHTGHETAVASVAAGLNLGVANAATIMSVRFDGPGDPPCWKLVMGECPKAWLSDMISAVDWVAANKIHPAVAVMSWGHPHDWVDDPLPGSLDDAVKAAVNAGVPFVTSAGNGGSGYDACKDTPGRIESVITVASSRYAADAHYDGSSAGPCVNVYAPGERVPVALANTQNTEFQTGTSLAAPHVAGVAAMALQQNPSHTPYSLRMLIGASATPDSLASVPNNTINRLLYSHFTAAWIQGPLGIAEPGTYTWTATSYGGHYPHAYNWFRSDDGGFTYFWVGSGISYSSYFGQGSDCVPFALRLVTDTNVEIRTTYHGVTVRIEPCPM
jgi:aqualysin 1